MLGVSEQRYVVLKAGLALPVEPIQLAIDLESRDFSLRQEDGDVLSVQPCQRLTEQDCAAIRKWKRHLLSLLNYQAPEVP